MESPAVNERLIAILKKILGPGASAPDTIPMDKQLSELGVTSLKMVNLMLAVELEFDISIPQSDITPENFHALSTIATLVARLRGEGAG